MNASRIALYFAVAGLFPACSYVPQREGSARPASPDYTSGGEVRHARAFMYGNTTVLEFDAAPAFLAVRDNKGASVDYERVGRYYRLPHALETFTVWVNGRPVTFSERVTTRVFSAAFATLSKAPAQAPHMLQAQSRADAATAAAAQIHMVKPQDDVAAAPIPPAVPPDEDAAALLNLCQLQLAQTRQLLDAATRNPQDTHAELLKVSQRLDEIEARMITAAAAIVRVTFPTASTAFKPSAQVAQVLVAAGKAADAVNVRGRTDSRVAGVLDAKIALGRALAARTFLVDRGVDAGKIKVFWQADGDFAAPNKTKEGRALNRRVEFEFVDARIARLKSQALNLAASAAQ